VGVGVTSDVSRLPILSMARRIAAFGLEDPEPLRVSEARWPALLGVVVSQRLTGLAEVGIREGWLRVSSAQEAELIGRQREAMLRSLAIERLLVRLATSLDEASVPFVVLKGAAVAHTAYPDPEWRPFGDLDILVRGQDWHHALGIVQNLGFRRDLPEPHRGFDVRFGKAATHTNEEGLQLDLHRMLTLGPFGLWIEPDELFAGTTQLVLGGRRLRRLDDASLFLHACVHASLGWRPPLLLPLRDVVQIATALPVYRAVVIERARDWRLGAVVHHAVATASELCGGTSGVLPRLVDGLVAGPRERRVLRAYTTGRRRRGGLALSTVRAVPGLARKATYVRDMVLPSREFLTARAHAGTARSSYARRWAVPFGWIAKEKGDVSKTEESDVRYRRHH